MTFKPKDLVKQAINRHDKHIAVACSFGKDSIKVLRMALDIEPNIKVIFENTGVEFPETIKYKEKLKKEWNLNLHETKPLRSFWDCANSCGLPKARKQGGKGSNSPRCCKDLKEIPGLQLQKELKVNAVFTGLQACESRSRSLIAKRYDNNKATYMEKSFNDEVVEFCSQRWYTKSTGIWNYHPIMLTSTPDVWNWTLKNKIEINPVYWKWNIYGKIHNNIPKLKVGTDRLILNGIPALYPRCGCLPCTAYLSWEERLSKSHNKLYLKLKQMNDPKQRKLL